MKGNTQQTGSSKEEKPGLLSGLLKKTTELYNSFLELTKIRIKNKAPSTPNIEMRDWKPKEPEKVYKNGGTIMSTENLDDLNEAPTHELFKLSPEDLKYQQSLYTIVGDKPEHANPKKGELNEKNQPTKLSLIKFISNLFNRKPAQPHTTIPNGSSPQRNKDNLLTIE